MYIVSDKIPSAIAGTMWLDSRRYPDWIFKKNSNVESGWVCQYKGVEIYWETARPLTKSEEVTFDLRQKYVKLTNMSWPKRIVNNLSDGNFEAIYKDGWPRQSHDYKEIFADEESAFIYLKKMFEENSPYA